LAKICLNWGNNKCGNKKYFGKKLWQQKNLWQFFKVVETKNVASKRCGNKKNVCLVRVAVTPIRSGRAAAMADANRRHRHA
jgi:hypothetical protein